MEKWKLIPDAPDYSISDQGRIRRELPGSRTHCGMILTNNFRVRGYAYISLRVNGERKTFQVHRLVAAAFVPIPSEVQVNHKNGIKDDNRAENLEYVTASGNQLHARRVLGKLRGSTHAMAKLTEADIQEIRKMAREDKKKYGRLARIARRFNVTPENIGHIVNGKSWSHVKDVSAPDEATS